jgi:hypothetical protein
MTIATTKHQLNSTLAHFFGKKGTGSNFKVYSRFELPGEISPEIETKNQILVNELSF